MRWRPAFVSYQLSDSDRQAVVEVVLEGTLVVWKMSAEIQTVYIDIPKGLQYRQAIAKLSTLVGITFVEVTGSESFEDKVPYVGKAARLVRIGIIRESADRVVASFMITYHEGPAESLILTLKRKGSNWVIINEEVTTIT